MNPDVLQPIPRAQIVKQAAVALALGGLIVATRARIFAWLGRTLTPKQFFLVVAASLFGVAVLMGGYGIRVIKAKQFPPPKAQVWRPTPILRNGAALVRGWVVLGCSMVVAACAFGFALIPFIYFRK